MMPEYRTLVLLVFLGALTGCAGLAAPEQGREEANGEPVTMEDVVAINNQALALKEQGRFREAAGLLRTGIDSSPETPELHYNLAVISELYLLDLKAALLHYHHYRELSGSEDKQVAGWIADLERRLQ
ncbi:hypothetical protein [Marinobacter sp. NP-4(2019)]|uniref:hypothetical protein n=1 Tax=Marinobacter sp. NP-4(2019) TaxID=2488665 RepID=UPI001D18B227|nr:hypothetical protein [Marinobacter sp. NP-4(2019)]